MRFNITVWMTICHKNYCLEMDHDHFFAKDSLCYKKEFFK